MYAEGHPGTTARMVHAGKPLGPGRTLREYGIVGGATLFTMLRLTGGSGEGGTGLSQRMQEMSMMNEEERAGNPESERVGREGEAHRAIAHPPGLEPEAGGQRQELQIATELFAEFMEEVALEAFEIIAAGAGNTTITPRYELNNWTAWEATLGAIGFDVNQSDHWLALGVPMGKRANAQKATARRRTELVKLLATIARRPAWSREDMTRVEGAVEAFEKHAEGLMRELASRTDRGESSNGGMLRQELGNEALDLVTALIPMPRQIATQCLHEIVPMEALPEGTLPREEAARVSAAMASSNGAAAILQAMGEGELVLWSPNAPEDVGRVLGNFVRRVSQQGRGLTMHLVSPVEPLPGCCAATSIMQHWAHPALTERWAGVLERVCFATQPLEVMPPGARGAQAKWTALSIMTFKKGAVLAIPSVVMAAEPVARAEEDTTLLLEFPAALEAEVHRLLGPGTPQCWRRGEPRRSVASTKEAPRLRMTLHASREDVTLADPCTLR